MTSCAEVREELVAALRGEASPETAAAIERHLERCAPCSAERDGLRRTMELVRDHVHPELSPDARFRLRDALESELVRSRPRRWRRVVRPLFAVPVALAAGALIAWVAAPSRSTPAPQTAIAVVPRGRAVAVPEELGPKTFDAVTRGLEWLAERQQPDGLWSPAPESDTETRAAATASVLLAFAADGQTPRHGPHARSLAHAMNRLAGLVVAGFSNDPDRKPLYAQALAVRALTAIYRLDRRRMTSDERRSVREVLALGAQRLGDWQSDDGGFGYVPHAPRSDASCTLFAAAALTDLGDADLLDATGAISRAGRYLASLRGVDGGVAYMHPGDRRSTPALTAAFLALDGKFGPSAPLAPEALSSVESALAKGGDALLAWTGSAALARHGRTLVTPVTSLLASQHDNGGWTASITDPHCAGMGDTVTTAFSVLALSQVYAR